MRDEIAWDSVDEYFDKMARIYKEVKRVVKHGRYIIVNMADYIKDGKRYDLNFQWHELLKYEIGLEWRDTIIWKKKGELATIGAGKMASNFIKMKLPMYYNPDRNYEVLLVFSKGKPRIPDYSKIVKNKSLVDVDKYRDYLSCIWEIAPRQDPEHPAVFPYKLAEVVITLYSYVDEVVLDPFLGTGTTMRVAKDLGRSCIGCEINDKYIPIIKRNVRWGEQGLFDGNTYEIKVV